MWSLIYPNTREVKPHHTVNFRVFKHSIRSIIRSYNKEPHQMIHDLFKAAGRIHGFLKNNPGATPDQLRKWLEIIVRDQSNTVNSESRFSGFKPKTAAALRRYEEDINFNAAIGMGERAIYTKLKKQYLFAKNIPSASTIRRFLERKDG